MPSKQDLERRVKSVQNTKKITYAMKLVSAAKLKKAQDSALAARNYMDSLLQVLSRIMTEQAGSDVVHPLLQEREVKRIALVVVGGARGLSGAYNSNVNKRVEAFFSEMRRIRPGATIEAFLLGKKVGEHFRRVQRKFKTSEEALPEDPFRWPLQELSHKLCSAFELHEYDEIYLIYTKFKSAMSMSVQLEKLLPLSLSELPATKNEIIGPTLFEPSIGKVMSDVLPRIIQAMMLRAALDAKAGEHGSRMAAMDSASKNAGDLIQTLKLTMNKLRQSKITSELLDIIGGAEAIR